jgi:DNA-binding transcriptional LysR family regulator
MLETRELSYFAKIVEEGSFRKAAESIGISQPALTKCIRLFEQRLNVKLLIRGPAGVELTTYGRSLYARAKAVVAEVARAKMELEEISGIGSATLTVGTLPSQASDLLPEAAVRFTNMRPGSRLFVIEKRFSELVAGLKRGDFDFIVSSTGRYEADRALVHRTLFRDRPVIIVRQGHALTKLRAVRSKDLTNWSWVLPPPDTTHRRIVERMFAANNVPVPRGIIECHSASFLKSVVMHSDYIGILPSNVLTHEERSGAIVALNVQPELPTRPITISYRADFPLSDAANALIREIRSLAKRKH